MINLENNTFVDSELIQHPSLSDKDLKVWGYQDIETHIYIDRQTGLIVNEKTRLDDINNALALYVREYVNALNTIRSCERQYKQKEQDHERLKESYSIHKEQDAGNTFELNRVRDKFHNRDNYYTDKLKGLRSEQNELKARMNKLEVKITELKAELSKYYRLKCFINGFPELGNLVEFDYRKHFVDLEYKDNEKSGVTILKNKKLGNEANGAYT